ncbi:hypothetical protein ACFLWX_00935 [Chloroflexota bacterium]
MFNHPHEVAVEVWPILTILLARSKPHFKFDNYIPTDTCEVASVAMIAVLVAYGYDARSLLPASQVSHYDDKAPN